MSRVILLAALSGLLATTGAVAQSTTPVPVPATAPTAPLATTLGIVDGGAAENGVIWFTLAGSDLRFEVSVDDVTDPDAILAALRESADTRRSLLVRYDMDSGMIDEGAANPERSPLPPPIGA